jgi:site-specific recombinase XerD
MKNTSTPLEATWHDDLRGFDAHLKARGMAEKTRRAYGTDIEQLAVWAAANGVEARAMSPRMLRRFAGVLSERGLSKTSTARKLASIRSFYRHLVQRGELEANPADLVATPKRDSYLPRVLKSAEVAELLDRIPASEPLDVRDRAIFELAYGSGLRAEELVNLDLDDLDPDGEELRVSGKGAKTRVVPAGEQTWAALGRYLERARPELAAARRGGRSDPALFL